MLPAGARSWAPSSMVPARPVPQSSLTTWRFNSCSSFAPILGFKGGNIVHLFGNDLDSDHSLLMSPENAKPATSISPKSFNADLESELAT